MRSTITQIGIILLISAVLAGVANCVHPRKIPWVEKHSDQVESRAKEQNQKIIGVAQAQEKFRAKSAVFVDARTAEEFSKGHIPGAISLPFAHFTDEEFFMTTLDLVDSGKELVVYCSSRECDDGRLLAAELETLGSTNVILFIDGFDGWENAGGEVEK
ncbi:MAG: rhodanese-like domain-containing protein [Pontiellaceae bacterium]|nr:rhodanese-like domain-containing protein [Pontiellaceae bacterium]